MTILEQAETIRDETSAGSNTADRVGSCLVDIANALGNIVQGQNSASFCFTVGHGVNNYGRCDTPCPTSGTRLVLIDGPDTEAFKIIIGNGPTITNDSGTFYFSGMDEAKAYTVTFSLSFLYDDGKYVAVGLRNPDESLNSIRGALRDFNVGGGGVEPKNLTVVATVTGTSSAALVISGEADTTFVLTACNATIVELGTLTA